MGPGTARLRQGPLHELREHRPQVPGAAIHRGVRGAVSAPNAPAGAARRDFAKPILVISECLEFEPCRYDGARIRFDFVKALEPHVQYRPVCPEVQVGLGVPRDTIRLVALADRNLLVQPATGRDLTDDMEGFAARHLDGLGEVDGFILKSRSPSCGLGHVKVFNEAESRGVVRRGAGVFAAAVLTRYGDLAVEDEGRLRNHRIREHFLTKLFALARLRDVARGGRITRLVGFHAAYKFLLLAYSERDLRELGRIVANPGRERFVAVFADYRTRFLQALSDTPRYTSVINVFQHISGFFRKELSRREKAHFAELLDRYREGQLPASAIASLLESWAVRFGSTYIMDQALFAPFPKALTSPADSGKGRAAGRSVAR
ncbi:MAG: DUF523 and DUF1722 domain-containing protein [Gemmatimonadetes bacterium]|nr:DUF523 and DUF1722 domain-containing protein [Gemmatimonadota bacterium]MYG21929.1 DUF523 and DUF1722 domain-containing protein [Gemmatimonadota bacterium]MYJ39393.1 DUF523 and DUF1722 domain-containing protein [Gemmatimonadota bacterium]